MYRFLPRNILRPLTNPNVPLRNNSGFAGDSKTRYQVQQQSAVRWLSSEHVKTRDSMKSNNYNTNMFNYGFQEKNLKKKKKMKVRNLFRAKTKPMNIIDLTNIMMANNLAKKWSKLNQEKKKQKKPPKNMSQQEQPIEMVAAIDQKPNKNTKGIIKALPKTKGMSVVSSDYSDILKEKCNKSKSKNSDLTTVNSLMSVISKSPKSRTSSECDTNMFDLLSADLCRNKLNSDGKLVYADLITTPRPISKMKFARFWKQHPVAIVNNQPPPPPPPQPPQPPHKCTVTAMPKRAPIKTKAVLSSKIHPVKPTREKRLTQKTWTNKIEEPEGGGKRYKHTKPRTKLNRVERKLKLLNEEEARSKSSKDNFVLAFVSPEEAAKSRNKTR